MRKKIIAIAMVIILVVGAGITTWLVMRVPRSQTLRIYNWGDFIERDLIRDFQRHWQRETGRRFRVVYRTFESNEAMYNNVVRNRADFDLLIPSDYKIEQMRGEGLLQPLNPEWLPSLTEQVRALPYSYLPDDQGMLTIPRMTHQWRSDIISPRILDAMDFLTPSDAYGVNTLYAVPYFYGTLGILYDSSVTVGNLIPLDYLVYRLGWASLWLADSDTVSNAYLDVIINDHHAVQQAELPISEQTPMTDSLRDSIRVAIRNTIPSMKSIGRDSFTVAKLVYHREEILSLDLGNAADLARRDEIMREIFEQPVGVNAAQDMADRIGIAEDLLNSQHSSTFYEIDLGKMRLINGEGPHVLGAEWSVSAVFAMMSNTNLAYHVPPEGTNLWVDAMVIPTRARNVRAAHAFIEFISRPVNAMRNMDWVGGTSPILTAANAHGHYLRTQSQLFDHITPQGQLWRDRFIDEGIFPTEAVLTNGGIMRFLGDTFAMNIDAMMLRVRAS